MPELPEVETIRIGLSRLLPGQIIKSVDFDWPKGFPNSKNDTDRFLVGASIVQVRRRAKVLIIDLDSKYSLIIHLKMTGQLVFVRGEQKLQARKRKHETRNELQDFKNIKGQGFGFRNSDFGFAKSADTRFGAGHPNDSLIGDLPDRSTRVVFEFKDAKLFFNDQRKFGWVKLLPTSLINMALTGSVLEASARKQRAVERAVQKSTVSEQRSDDAAIVQEPILQAELESAERLGGTGAVIDFFKKVGPEPLSDNFTAGQFIERLQRRKNSPIKAVLLDQTVIAGIGNIYADESLWGAKINPSQKVSDIPNNKLKKLFTEIQYVLRLSIEKGGSTDRNYVNAEGKKGSYIDFARVFRKENLPCPRCGTTIIKTRVAGRGTHTCPKCQQPTRLERVI